MNTLLFFVVCGVAFAPLALVVFLLRKPKAFPTRRLGSTIKAVTDPKAKTVVLKRRSL